ncbi:2-oxoacid ferredoxin oxidoreductase [Candidatus Micrarchaeota archaeon RBG_16_49_10]|nr:MAG: 2-oxoacid ferredoxin oxidoreductase [Candidatus Micrarchaeota archaeon RBG_16_49_10]
MVSLADLDREKEVMTWCPGCGNFTILSALKKALVSLKVEPHNAVVVAGIGCSGHLPNWINIYGFGGLHGRTLPVASAIKLSNHKLTVIAQGGDGDGYSIGIGHFIHTARRNIDITYITHNNQIYGLTTGQTSPTSPRGTVTKFTPFGSLEDPLNPIALAITSGATFVARGFAGDLEQLTKLFQQAISHNGFALVDVLQPCVTFNRTNTFQWFRERVYKLDDGYDPTDKVAAYRKALEWGDRIPTGVFYRVKRRTYSEGLPQISKTPLVKQRIGNVDIVKLVKQFM